VNEGIGLGMAVADDITVAVGPGVAVGDTNVTVLVGSAIARTGVGGMAVSLGTLVVS